METAESEVIKLCWRGIIWLVAGDKKKAYPLFEEARKNKKKLKNPSIYIFQSLIY